MRDCYLDYTSDKLDIRLGRQQVVWGQSDGIPILDRINPFDLTPIYEEGQNQLGLKIISLHSLFKVMLGDLNPDEEAVLD